MKKFYELQILLTILGTGGKALLVPQLHLDASDFSDLAFRKIFSAIKAGAVVTPEGIIKRDDSIDLEFLTWAYLHPIQDLEGFAGLVRKMRAEG